MKESLMVDTVPVKDDETDIVIPAEDVIVDDPICDDSVCDGDENPTDDTLVPANPDVVEPLPDPIKSPVNPVAGQISVATFFGTLQESVTIAWRMHLKTKSYIIHNTLNDYYNSALYNIDKLIESYQGIYGVIEDPYLNILFFDDPVEYFTELRSFIRANKMVIGDNTEINSILDEILGLIDSVVYKITNLHENAVKSFEEFCYEDL